MIGDAAWWWGNATYDGNQIIRWVANIQPLMSLTAGKTSSFYVRHLWYWNWSTCDAICNLPWSLMEYWHTSQPNQDNKLNQTKASQSRSWAYPIQAYVIIGILRSYERIGGWTCRYAHASACSMKCWQKIWGLIQVVWWLVIFDVIPFAVTV